MNIPMGTLLDDYYKLLYKAKGESKYPFIPPLRNKNGSVFPDMASALRNAMLTIQELQADPLEYMRAQMNPYLRSRMRTLFPPSRLYGEGAKKRYLSFIKRVKDKYSTAQEKYTTEEIKREVEKTMWNRFMRKGSSVLETLYTSGHLFSERFIIQKLLLLSQDAISNYLCFLNTKDIELFQKIRKELFNGKVDS